LGDPVICQRYKQKEAKEQLEMSFKGVNKRKHKEAIENREGEEANCISGTTGAQPHFSTEDSQSKPMPMSYQSP